MARTLKIRVDASGIKKASLAAGKLGKKFAGIGRKLKGVTAGLFSMKTMILGAMGTGFVMFLKSMFTELGESEVAVRGLATAMKAGGQYTAQAHKNLLDYAQALTKTTAYEDDAIIGAMRMIATFKLSEETIVDATQATLDMAAATGQDLQSAAILMGKAAVGETGTLKRYGLVVDEVDLKTRGFAAVLDEVRKNFGGQAEMVRGTVKGSMMLLSNMWGNMKEDIAKTLVESGAFKDMMQTLEGVITDIVEYVKANPRIIGNLFETGVAAGKSLIAVTQSLLPFFKFIVENKTVLMAVMGAFAGAKIGGAFGSIGAGVGMIAGGIGGAIFGSQIEEVGAAPSGEAAQMRNIIADTRNRQLVASNGEFPLL